MKSTHSLKQRTISAILWNSFDQIVEQTLHFVIALTIARILSPDDYGLIGMLTIFVAIGGAFVSSGFGQALIRKKEIKQEDLSTVFYFNVAVAFIAYFVLAFSAPYIAKFFNEPRLEALSRFFFLNLIINAFGMIQNTILAKEIEFRALAKVGVFSCFLSGLVGIILAYRGFEVWALAAQGVSGSLFRTAFLWKISKWKPSLIFSWNSFRELFSFGSRLLASSILNVIVDNIYTFIIGKFHSAKELGLYTQANRIQQIPSKVINTAFLNVSYPVLSTIQNDDQRLKSAYKKLITTAVYINFPIMLGLMAIAKPLVLVLLTEKWLPSVIFLQLLCIVGFRYPLSTINLNILKVKGRSDIFFYLELAKKFIIFVTILITLPFGLHVLVIGQILSGFINTFLNMYYSGRLIQYSTKEQLIDIFPYLFISISMAISTYSLSFFLKNNNIVLLFVQISFGSLFYYFGSKVLRLKAMEEVTSILKNRLSLSHYS